MTWFKHATPEELLESPDKRNYLVKLANGDIIKTSRSNGHWFGMWRWLRDNEVKEWIFL